MGKLLHEFLEIDERTNSRYHTSEMLSRKWFSGDEVAVPRVDNELAKNNLTTETIMARALAMSIKEVESIDRLIAAAETRRDKALNNIEKGREKLAKRHEQTTDVVFEEIAAAE